MRVYIGADHAGVEVKDAIAAMLKDMGMDVHDAGTASPDTSVDYPDYAAAVAEAVSTGKCDRGVLVCGSGIGMAIAANKFAGVRAAVCHNLETAELSRRHNDANVLAIGSRTGNMSETREIVKKWFETPFDAGRHQKRVDKISGLEKGGCACRDKENEGKGEGGCCGK